MSHKTKPHSILYTGLRNAQLSSHILLNMSFFPCVFQTYYFEEFEGLLDELLFRLNVLSNSLHHTLPAKAQRYREDTPVVSPVPIHLDTQVIPSMSS